MLKAGGFIPRRTDFFGDLKIPIAPFPFSRVFDYVYNSTNLAGNFRLGES
jgi:hypothetical protein